MKSWESGNSIQQKEEENGDEEPPGITVMKQTWRINTPTGKVWIGKLVQENKKQIKACVNNSREKF